MNPGTDFAAMLEQARAVRLNPTASVAQLRDAAEQAQGAVTRARRGKRSCPIA